MANVCARLWNHVGIIKWSFNGDVEFRIVAATGGLKTWKTIKCLNKGVCVCRWGQNITVATGHVRQQLLPRASIISRRSRRVDKDELSGISLASTNTLRDDDSAPLRCGALPPPVHQSAAHTPSPPHGSHHRDRGGAHPTATAVLVHFHLERPTRSVVACPFGESLSRSRRLDLDAHLPAVRPPSLCPSEHLNSSSRVPDTPQRQRPCPVSIADGFCRHARFFTFFSFARHVLLGTLRRPRAPPRVDGPIPITRVPRVCRAALRGGAEVSAAPHVRR